MKKSRNTEIPDPILAEFDEATGGLRAVDPVRFEELRTGKETKSTLSNVIGYLGIRLSTPMLRKDLIVELCGIFQCSERTIESKFKEIFDQNKVINTPLGPKILEKESRPDGLYYKLSDPEPPTASANPI